MATAATYTAPLETARAKVLEAHRLMAGGLPAGIREATLETIRWLEQPSGFNVVGPAIASVAGTSSQRQSYLELAHGIRELARDVTGLSEKFGPILVAGAPDLHRRFEAAAAALTRELTRFASVMLCLVDAPDDKVTDEDAELADRLRFESAKGVVLTMHDEAFKRLAK